jgi:hypothetical protein
MAAKKIDIQIVTTGGPEAAEKIRRVEESLGKTAEAAKSVEQVDGDKLGSMFDGVPESAKEAGQGVEDLREGLEALKERAAELREDSVEFQQSLQQTETGLKLGKAAMVGKALGAVVLAKSLKDIARAVESIDLDHLRELDDELANQAESAQTWAKALQDPIGAIQELISGSTIGEAFEGMNEQLALNAQMQAEAVNRMVTAGRKTAEELKAVAQEIAAANKILDAVREAEGKERDVEDQNRVIGGEAPEDVKIQRAAWDRDRELERINRDLEPEAKQAQAIFDDSRVAKLNAQRVEANPDATREQKQQAREAAAEAEKRSQKALEDYSTSKQVAEQQRRGVRADYEGTVASATDEKARRIAKEKERAEEQRKRDEEKKKRQAEKDARDSQKARTEALGEELESAEGGLKESAFNASRRILNRNKENRTKNSTLQSIGNKLTDGTDAMELQKISDQIVAQQAKLGAANVAGLNKIIAELKTQTDNIEKLEAKIKNSRKGRP